MSEYQYYEFLAIDKPLTSEETLALRAFDPGPHHARQFYQRIQLGRFQGQSD